MNLFSFKRRSSKPPAPDVPAQRPPPPTLPRTTPATPYSQSSSTTCVNGASSSTPSFHPSHNDLYDTLHSYTFGAPQPSLLAPAVDPLNDDDDYPGRTDTTPRPSLATPHPSHPSQSPSQSLHSPHPSPSRRQTADTASTASNSVPSSRSVSRSSRRPDSSAGFSDYLDDHRHPLPSHLSSADSLVSADGFNDVDSAHDIEVGSTAHPASERATYWDYNRSIPPRRGSLAMPIPGTPSDRSYMEFRNREDSLITLRRPSRSLDEINPTAATLDPDLTRDRALPPAPTSMPASEGDWRDLRRRDDAEASRTTPAPAAVESAANELNLGEFANFFNNMDTLNREMRDIIQPMSSRGSGRLFSFDRRRSSNSSTTDLFVRRTNAWSGKESDWIFTRTRGDERDRDYNWKGMVLEAEEHWKNALTGRFNVRRKNETVKDSAKPPSQRIHIRPEFGSGPILTIHKHSKTSAFSISRHYRIRNKDTKRTMVLLGQRSVQSSYTSTASTRKLETHGQLDTPRESSRHVHDRHGEGLSHPRPESPRSSHKPEKKKKTSSKKSGQEEDGVTSRESSSFGSVAASTLVNVSGPDTCVRPGSSSKSVAPSVISHGSDSTVGPPKAVLQIEQELEQEGRDEEYVYDDERPPPVRTPHSEAYGTIPPEVLETISSSQRDREGRRFYLSPKPKLNGGASQNQLQPYNPPWLIPASRHQAEARNGIVTDLNHSFRDVGLLPVPTSDVKNGSHRQRQSDSQKLKQQQMNAAVMEHDDAFYMLLPLWPGSTDDASTRKHPFVVPDIPLQKRQYLLVFYKSEESKGKGKQHDGKKDSPTSSWGSVKDDRGLILTSFHISARIVPYEELQGSGFRIPDEGLAVAGPLKEAYDSMPSPHEFRSSGLKGGVVIGLCSSRDGGIQFIKHGFLELGLCTATYPPPYEQPISEDVSGVDWDGPPANAHPPIPVGLTEEENTPPEAIITPTPIGLAVMEMAWAGGIALTSFGPAS